MSSTSEDNRAPGSLSLIHAASDGDVQTMKALLTSGADPNTTNHGGQSALMVAALMGHVEVVALLLEAGADPQANDRLGLTALEWSKRRGFPEVTQLLVTVTPSTIRPKPKSTSEPAETKTEKEINNAVEADLHPERLGPASRAAHNSFLANRTDEEAAESHSRETQQEQPAVVTSPEKPSMEPAGEPAGAGDAVIATGPTEAEDLELPITSERQSLPADESVLDLSIPQVAVSDHSQTPEADTLSEAVPEPQEAVLEPQEAVLEPQEALVESQEAVLESQEAVTEPPEAVTESPEAVVEPAEAVPEPPEAVPEPPEAVLEPPEDVTEPPEDVLVQSAETFLTDEDETLPRSHPTPALEPPRGMSADPPAIAVPESKTERVAPKPATKRSRSSFAASPLGLSTAVSDESEMNVNLKGIDDSQSVAAPSRVSVPMVLWVLGAFVLGVSSFGAYKLMGYLSRSDAPPVPIAAKPVEKPPEIKKPSFTVGGDLAGLEVNVPEPAYPIELQKAGVSESITVRIKVNKKGHVISAATSKGDPRFRAAAVKAATQATFSPEKLEQVDSRTRVVSGTITYEFVSAPAGPSTSSTATASPATVADSATTSPTGTSAPNATTNADPNAPVVSEELAGAVEKVPTADYPSRAKQAGIGATIIVTVRVNRAGKVVSWRTSTGDSQLRAAALKAARNATFSPAKLSGTGDVLGTITYKFTP